MQWGKRKGKGPCTTKKASPIVSGIFGRNKGKMTPESTGKSEGSAKRAVSVERKQNSVIMFERENFVFGIILGQVFGEDRTEGAYIYRYMCLLNLERWKLC